MRLSSSGFVQQPQEGKHNGEFDLLLMGSWPSYEIFLYFILFDALNKDVAYPQSFAVGFLCP